MTQLRVLGLAVSAFALLAAAPVSAENYQHKGFYVGAGAGLTMPLENEVTSSGVATHKLDFDPGYVVNGFGGYAFGNGLRTELELGYRQADVKGGTNPNLNPAYAPGGDYSVFNAMANLYYDMDINWILTPYVGVGIGYAHVSADGLSIAPTAATILGASDDSAGQFAYQAIGGVSYDITGHWAATLDYRYLGTPELDFGNMKSEYTSHNVMLGLRYHFDAPATAAPVPEPAPVAPAPVAQPAAPAVANTYIVFFDFDKASLTPEAKNILAAVAADYKRGKNVTINVTGHADRSGKDGYNQKLSVRRAASVKSELARLGVPNAEVTTKGLGETTPLVPTADGVREAQNRRAEIVFGTK